MLPRSQPVGVVKGDSELYRYNSAVDLLLMDKTTQLTHVCIGEFGTGFYHTAISEDVSHGLKRKGVTDSVEDPPLSQLLGDGTGDSNTPIE